MTVYKFMPRKIIKDIDGNKRFNSEMKKIYSYVWGGDAEKGEKRLAKLGIINLSGRFKGQGSQSIFIRAMYELLNKGKLDKTLLKIKKIVIDKN